MTRARIILEPTEIPNEYDINDGEQTIGAAYIHKNGDKRIKLFKEVTMEDYMLIFYEMLNEIEMVKRM